MNTNQISQPSDMQNCMLLSNQYQVDYKHIEDNYQLENNQRFEYFTEEQNGNQQLKLAENFMGFQNFQDEQIDEYQNYELFQLSKQANDTNYGFLSEFCQENQQQNYQQNQTFQHCTQIYFPNEFQNQSTDQFLNSDSSQPQQLTTDVSIMQQDEFNQEHQYQNYHKNCQCQCNQNKYHNLTRQYNEHQLIKKKKIIQKSKVVHDIKSQKQVLQEIPKNTKRITQLNIYQKVSSQETKNLFILLVPILQKKILLFYPQLKDKLDCLNLNKNQQNSLKYLNTFLEQCIQNQSNQEEIKQFKHTSIFILRQVLTKYSLNCKRIITNYLASKYTPAFEIIFQNPGKLTSIKNALVSFKKKYVKDI
ncbi:hypothetical protein ABPG72_004995 [Tetrahymena utriculariae]